MNIRRAAVGKRITSLDTLGEIRRALRILRRAERWLVQCERDEKRLGKKRLERARRARQESASASREELAEQG